jgi:hypothetical protein
LKATDEKSRIQIQIRKGVLWILKSGAVPKCHRSTTMLGTHWYTGMEQNNLKFLTYVQGENTGVEKVKNS